MLDINNSDKEILVKIIDDKDNEIEALKWELADYAKSMERANKKIEQLKEEIKTRVEANNG